MYKAVLKGILQSLLALLLLILFVASLLVCTVGVIWYTDSKLKFPVDSRKVPDGFPILVMTPRMEKGKYDARIVLKSYLNDYLKDHPDFTYLVPDGLDESLRNALRQKIRPPGRQPDTFDADWNDDFRVEKSEKGRQFLKVRHEACEDYVNVGWYEATDKAITPKYYKHYFGPALAFYAMRKGPVIAIALWAIGIFAYVMIRWRRRRRRRQELAEQGIAVEPGVQVGMRRLRFGPIAGGLFLVLCLASRIGRTFLILFGLHYFHVPWWFTQIAAWATLALGLMGIVLDTNKRTAIIATSGLAMLFIINHWMFTLFR